MRSMFNLKKVKKARRRLKFIGDILFKLFQLNLRYKENRKDMDLKFMSIFIYHGNLTQNLMKSIL